MRSLFFLLPLVAFAADPPKLPAPYDALVAQAHASPPEFASEALLRTAEGAHLPPGARAAVIEEAFRLALSAHFPYPQTAVRQQPDTRSASLVLAYRQHLDTLSLQTRAVRDLLGTNPSKARALFGEIIQPSVKPPGCDDLMTPDSSAFYETLGMVAQSTFTPEERKKEEDVNFVLAYLARVSAPSEFPAVERMIQSLPFNAAQRDVVTTRFNAIVKAAPGPLTCKQPPPNTDAYWQSDLSKSIFNDARKLFLDANGVIAGAARRATPEWRQQLTDFLQELGSWTGSDEDAATYFDEKTMVYRQLIETAEGEERQRTVNEFLQFLSNSNLQQTSPVEWFVPAQALYDHVHDFDAAQAAALLKTYEESGNPALMLLALEQRIFGSSRPSWAQPAIS